MFPSDNVDSNVASDTAVVTDDDQPNSSSLSANSMPMDSIVIEDTAASQMTKDRSRSSTQGDRPGAQQVNERAPQLNVRFFRGRTRRSASHRARVREERERRGATGAGQRRARNSRNSASIDDTHSRGLRQNIRARFTSAKSGLVNATAVEQTDVVEAEQMGFWNRNTKLLAMALCSMLLTVGILLVAFLEEFADHEEEHEHLHADPPPTFKPTLSPSASPEPGLTLAAARSRGYILCGLGESQLGFFRDLCRSVAAVVIGDPDSFEPVNVTSSDRFFKLQDRDIDLLVRGETYTVEREVRERTTGSGFSFSAPYFYDGMVYTGDETFVHCAENRIRYGNCSSLSICAENSTTTSAFVRSVFPSTFLHMGSTFSEVINMLSNDTCNVVAAPLIQTIAYPVVQERINSRKIIIGNRTFSKDPLAIVTRNDDPEWSDIVNWVVQALFYGEEYGMTHDLTLCPNRTNVTTLNFFNAIYCVGTYEELFLKNNKGRFDRPPVNNINDGTGMLYSIPLYEIEGPSNRYGGSSPESMLDRIESRGNLNCGFYIRAGFGEINGNPDSDDWIGMDVDYCRSLAAAIFNGDYFAVNLVPFYDVNDSYMALSNGTIDVLAGGSVHIKYDIKLFSQFGGFSYSTPYFYGQVNDDDEVVLALVILDGDAYFSSFVNAIVLATFYAEEAGITRDYSEKMPFATIFGTNRKWAYRDCVAYSGSYGEIYKRNFNTEGTGRNRLNSLGRHPQFLSLPGLSELY